MRKLFTFWPCGLALLVPIALADPMPEIVVTADLRGQTTMETGSSVTVINESVIKHRAAQHFEDIINAIPNVNYSSGSNRARFFQIRGIGERSQFINPINPSVGVLIDDVDFSGAGSIATLIDVKQVEVLRGPQGTRYGANALAGLINIQTNDPDDSHFASLKLSVAEYGTGTFGFVGNLPISAQLKARFVIESHKSDGYMTNDFLGRDDLNDRDELTLRTKLAWNVADNWDINLSIANIDVDNGYDAFSLDNTRHTLSDEPGFDRQDSTYVSLKSMWRWEAFNMEFLLNQAASDLDYGYDEDWSFTGIHPFGYTSMDQYFRKRDTSSIELRLLSNDSARILSDSSDWVVGIYALRSDENLLRQYTFLATNFMSQYDFETIAVFSEIDTLLSDSLTLSSGFRFERRDTNYHDSDGVRFTPNESHWGGRLALELNTEGGSLSYASVSRGYKAAGFNIDGSLPSDLRTFDEETLLEYELGLKTMLFDNRLALQVALFFDDRRDQQVKSSLVRPRADGSTEFIDFFGNAAKGTNQGVEVDAHWIINDNFSLTGNVGLLDAKFDEFTNEFGENLSGRDQAHAPGYMFNLSLNFKKGPWFAGFSGDGKDEFFFSDRHPVKSDSYLIYHGSLGYQSDHWKLTLWGRNLGDKDYFVRAFGSFGNDPRKSYVTEPYRQFGEPRITGITLEVNLRES